MNKKNTPKKTSDAAAADKTTAVRHSAVPPVATAKPEAAKSESVNIESVKSGAKVSGGAERAQTSAIATETSPVATEKSAIVTETSKQVAALIGQLRNPVAELAVEAAEKLADAAASTTDARISDALVDVLRNTDGYFNLVTRAAAAMALGRLKDTRAVETLIATTQDNQAEVSGEAVLALGQLKAKSALPALHKIVANEGNFFLNVTRHAALRALGQIADASSRPTFEAVLNAGSEDPAIVAAARQALASL